MIKAKKGALLPGGWRKRGRPATYPLETMKDGEYFDTDFRDGETDQQALKRLRTSTSTWRLKHHSSKKFAVRIVALRSGKRVIRVQAHESVPPVKRAKDVDAFFKS